MPQNSNETNEAESLAKPKDSSANEQVKPNEPNPADQSTQNNECEQGKDLKEADKKQELKLSAIFLAKWLGIFAAVLAVLFVITFIVGASADYTGSLYYRVRTLVVIAFVCAAPYTIAVVLLMAAGKPKRDRIWGAIKDAKNKRPSVFKGGVAAFTAALLVALFAFTTCPHSEWNPATCTEPKTCSACGETEGEALGHHWNAATCTEPKTCSRCGITEGKANGHTPGEWEEIKPDYVKATITTAQKCSVCGKTVDSKSEQLTSFVNGETFSIPASDLVERISKAYSSISGCSLKADSGLMKDGVTMSLDVKNGSSKVAAAGFVRKGTDDSLLPLWACGSENTYWQVLFSFASSSSSDEYAAETMYTLVQACDPSLSKDDAYAVGSEVLDNYKSAGVSKGIGQATKNGITYTLANSNGWMVSAKIG